MSLSDYSTLVFAVDEGQFLNLRVEERTGGVVVFVDPTDRVLFASCGGDMWYSLSEREFLTSAEVRDFLRCRNSRIMKYIYS